VLVDAARLERADESKDLRLAYEFLVIGPNQFEGRRHRHTRWLNNPDGVRWLKQELYNIGIDVTGHRLSELPDMLLDVPGRVIEIQVKTKKATGRDGTERDYTNTYLNKLLSDGKERALNGVLSEPGEMDGGIF
jgi:hypothetical protein